MFDEVEDGNKASRLIWGGEALELWAVEVTQHVARVVGGEPQGVEPGGGDRMLGRCPLQVNQAGLRRCMGGGQVWGVGEGPAD